MSSALSDYNLRKPSVLSATVPYTDLDLRDPFVNLIRKDLIAVTDIDAVKSSIRNLVLTNYYEVPFKPFRGSNIRALLFENADSFTAMAIQKEIKRVIEEYEPRVNRVVVDVVDRSDVNTYYVTINFNVISINTTGFVNFYLERLR